MLFQDRTRWNSSINMEVASTENSIDEGAALVNVMEDNIGKVKESTGDNDEYFVGVAYHMLSTPNYISAVEKITVPSSSETVQLRNEPQDPDTKVSVVDSDGNAFSFDADTTEALTFSVDGRDIGFHGDDEGKEVTVVYRHALTVMQARMLTGDGMVPGAFDVVEETKTIGVITDGYVFTSKYNTGDDWNSFDSNTSIVAGSDGEFAMSGNGASVRGFVVHAPTPEVPYLGLKVTV